MEVIHMEACSVFVCTSRPMLGRSASCKFEGPSQDASCAPGVVVFRSIPSLRSCLAQASCNGGSVLSASGV